MEALQAILTRRSIRRYTSQPVTDDTSNRAFESRNERAHRGQ